MLVGEHYILKWGDTFFWPIDGWCADGHDACLVSGPRDPGNGSGILGSDCDDSTGASRTRLLRRLVPPRAVQATVASVVSQPAIVFSVTCMIGILLAVKTGPHLPRYFAFVVPLLYFVFASTIFSVFHRRMASALFATIVVVNLVNWNGLLFPDMAWGMERVWGVPAAALARSGSFYERSHEYLVDHQSTIEAMRIVEQHRSDGEWIMGMPFTYYLAYPSFGYVKSPILGYSVNGITGVIQNFKETDDLYHDMPSSPIFIKEANYFCTKTAAFRFPILNPETRFFIAIHSHFHWWSFAKSGERPLPPQKKSRSSISVRSGLRTIRRLGLFSSAQLGTRRRHRASFKVHDSNIPSPEQKEWISDILGALLVRVGRTDEAKSIIQKNQRGEAGAAARRSQSVAEDKTKSRFDQELQSGNLDAFELGVLCLKHLRLEEAAAYFREYCQLAVHREKKM